VTTARVGAEPAYRDAQRQLDDRVEDLLARMTIDEKIAQLGSAWVFQLADRAGFSADKSRELLRDGLGQVTRVSGASSFGATEAARVSNEIQRYLVEQTRLGIPAIVHEEICSGLMAREATVFPQAIGLASSWEPELAEALADAVRVQMRARGAHQGLSPVLDVCRDPRWGRLEETFGEDPHLVARMGVAFVRGLQGADLEDGVIATAKHLVGYGASEGGMNWAPAHLPPRELHEVYLHPFEAAVRTAGLRSVMNAYNEIDGVPCASDWTLLTELLRGQWGFDGCVVADYFSIRQLADYHGLAADAAHAAAMALNAGLDVELPGTDCYGAPLARAFEDGLVAEQTIDTAVRRVLRSKFELGLFERPYVDADAAASTGRRAAERDLASRIARQSLVLLANDGTLPIGPDIRSVALIGPNADDARNLFGDYTYPAHVESLLEMMRSGRNVFAIPAADGLDAAAAAVDAPTVLEVFHDRLDVDVRFARGCGVSDDSRAGFDEAVAVAAGADVAIMVMGDKAGLTDDSTSGESRDRASLDLPGVQEDLVRAVAATGTPVVLVLVAGRPLGSADLHGRCAAVLLAWFPGEEGAGAIVDALTGDASPGGKLPISFPRSAGHVPVFYGHKVSGGRSHWKGDYVDAPSSPLYPFGHGLSYTSFTLSDPSLRETVVPSHGSIAAEVTVTNTGSRAGDEVVQLYVRDPQASVTRPVLELKGFLRVALDPGASRRLTFVLPVGQLGFYDRDLSYVVEPGTIEVSVGTSSVDLAAVGIVTVEDDTAAATQKAFDGLVTVEPVRS
jgi:beta-glucosidase